MTALSCFERVPLRRALRFPLGAPAPVRRPPRRLDAGGWRLDAGISRAGGSGSRCMYASLRFRQRRSTSSVSHRQAQTATELVGGE